MNTASRTTRTLGRKAMIQILVGAFVVLGLAAGLALGMVINRDPASAQEAPVPTCTILCDSTHGTGSVGINIAPTLGTGGSGTIGETATTAPGQ